MKKPLAAKTALVVRNINNTSRARARNTARWQASFLDALRKTPSIKYACSVAGIDRSTAYRRRQEDDEFAAKWQDAIQASVDELEHKAFELALAGNDNLITFMLRCHKPEVYRETQRHEVGLLAGLVILPEKKEGAE
jgi:hypothetical protein